MIQHYAHDMRNGAHLSKSQNPMFFPRRILFCRRLAALLVLLMFLAGSAAFAEVVPCSIEGSTSGSEITATVVPPGEVPLFLICTNSQTPPKVINLILSDFWNETGSVHVELMLPPGSQPTTTNGPLSLPFATVVLFRLRVQALPSEAKYSGRLVITADGKDPVVTRLTLTRGAPTGTLIADAPSAPLQISRTLSGSLNEPSFSVSLREKSGQIGLDGIRVRLEQVSKQPGNGFSIGKNVAFTVNGVPVSDLDVWPPTQAESYRSFAAGGQTVVGITLLNLEPGEYNAVLRFQATNSTTDDAQKVPIVVQVRGSIWWAIFWLLVAVAFSFFATKVLTSMRHRFNFLSRIRDLRPPWLSQEPSVLPVVWVRAVLKESEDLSRRFWLTGADLIDARVNQASAMIGLLSRVRDMRDQLKGTGLPRLPRIRAIAALGQIVAGLDDVPLNDAALTDANGKLTAFGNWVQPSTMTDCYWTTVCAEAVKLGHELALEEVTDQDGRAVMTELATVVKATLQQRPSDLDGMMAVERRYAALKILWQWHDSDRFGAFVSLVRCPPQTQQAVPSRTPDSASTSTTVTKDIDDAVLHQLFDLADRSTWELLKQAVSNGSVALVPPLSDGIQPLGAYDPLKFEIHTGDHRIDHAFLFKHALTFEWTFHLQFTRQWLRIRGASKTMLLNPTTSEPRVVQYFPRAGNVTAKVMITNAAGESLELENMDLSRGSMAIIASPDFGIFRGLANVEKISWALSAAVAIVTGLSMFYFKGSTFGSFQDYLTLFLWGAGVDQGKNFLQALQGYSAPPVKAAQS